MKLCISCCKWKFESFNCSGSMPQDCRVETLLWWVEPSSERELPFQVTICCMRILPSKVVNAN
jgi:hypothetical protein